MQYQWWYSYYMVRHCRDNGSLNKMTQPPNVMIDVVANRPNIPRKREQLWFGEEHKLPGHIRTWRNVKTHMRFFTYKMEAYCVELSYKLLKRVCMLISACDSWNIVTRKYLIWVVSSTGRFPVLGTFSAIHKHDHTITENRVSLFHRLRPSSRLL